MAYVSEKRLRGRCYCNGRAPEFRETQHGSFAYTRDMTQPIGKLDERGANAGVREELLEASDATIEEAVEVADPMVLRGLIYQLTGDPEIGATTVVMGASMGFMERKEERSSSGIGSGVIP